MPLIYFYDCFVLSKKLYKSSSAIFAPLRTLR